MRRAEDSCHVAGCSAQVCSDRDDVVTTCEWRDVYECYQSASCEQLWQQKGQPKSEEEQRVVQFLKNDPQARSAFLNQVAAPIANKMFECGMIP